MTIRFYKPYTSSIRHRSVLNTKDLTTTQPNKSLIKSIFRAKGRNQRGVITSRHRGGGHKRFYRQIDFKRSKLNLLGIVKHIEYDPNRNARIALVTYLDKTKSYILQAEGLKQFQTILTSKDAPIEIGNSLPLEFIPLGTNIYNVELHPGGGAQLARSAGTFATILTKEEKYASVRLPSGEIRLILQTCWATIGQVGNQDFVNLRMSKAGNNRWRGRRPSVRGSAMNPVDHPHGGGEGRCPIGRSRPVSLWGKAALGVKTRKPGKYSNRFIIKRRKK